jgi:Raf kinase inhibitor-like YbhB/YbcL family protein
VLRTLALALLVTAVACGSDTGSSAKKAQLPTPLPSNVSTQQVIPGGGSAANLGLTSTAFTEGGAIPKQYTCDGANQSPPWAWGAPKGTVSFALRVQDVDTAQKFVHWIVYDIAPSITSMATNQAPVGAKQAVNSFGKTGYGGPCPPAGQLHHYVFTLLALGTTLNVSESVSPTDLWAALENSAVTGKAELTGTYQRTGS